MKIQFCLAFFLCIAHFSYSQNTPVPDYVTSQNFPDSVLSLSLHKLDSQKISFVEILKKHEGKKIVIDVWASWCRDCLIGYPKLDDLRKKTDTARVAFVFISVDKDDTRWRNAIERFGITGEHYRSETAWYNTFTNYIVLDWVPRYVVLDERGKVIMSKAITADQDSLMKLFAD